MSSETPGIFGPGGRLAKVEAEEAEEEQDICAGPSLKQVAKNNLDNIMSKCQTVVHQLQESCGKLQQLNNDVQDLSVSSEASLLLSFVPLSDLPPMEAAFSIDKIRNAIFSHLEPRDFLRFRLVSSSWLRTVTYELLKWKQNKIIISQDYFTKDVVAHWGIADVSSSTGIGACRGMTRKPLTDLIDVLDGIHLHAHPFPCSAFCIFKLTLPQINSLDLFDRFGFLVTYLDFDFPQYGFRPKLVYYKGALVAFVTKLLTEQMPNLETLVVKFEGGKKIRDGIQPQLLFKIKNGFNATKSNENLQIFEIDAKMPFEVIETVCCLAPNMKQLVVIEGSVWGYGNSLLLEFKPKKKEEDTNCPHERDKLRNLFAILNPQYKVELLKFKTIWWRDKVYFDTLQAEFLKRIFDSSCHSLEELHLSPFNLSPEQAFPQMPKVRLLELKSIGDAHTSLIFFPPGTSLATTFPNLHTINIYVDYYGFKKATLYLCEDEEVVASVKRMSVHIYRCDYDATQIQKKFPNAVVTFK